MMQAKLPALTLAMETSCDETAVAILADGRHVLSSLVSSQISVHQAFGGVVPEVAAREHLKVLDLLVAEAMAEARVKISDIDLIAVTQGPGLIGALLVGVSYAKALALASGKPLLPVNHVHAHVHGALLGLDTPVDTIFPALAAVVSGGHTNLYFMATPTDFELLAYSIDDACGESFDKVAKLLHLGYPGGPAIEKLAHGGRPELIPMPRMMAGKDRLEFSYSGLKTHMVNLLAKEASLPEGQRLADICAAFQNEALQQLQRKLKQAMLLRPEAKQVLIAGGVAANGELRRLLAAGLTKPTLLPALRYCSDNAAMIGALAAYEYQAFQAQQQPLPSPDWDAYSRYDRRRQGALHGQTNRA